MKYTVTFDDGIDLKQELLKRKLTLREFSKISGIHFATLSTIAGGGRCSEERATHIKKCLQAKALLK